MIMKSNIRMKKHEPVKWLSLSLKTNNERGWSSPSGMLPVRELESSSRLVKFGSLPIELGIVPWNWAKRRRILLLGRVIKDERTYPP